MIHNTIEHNVEMEKGRQFVFFPWKIVPAKRVFCFFLFNIITVAKHFSRALFSKYALLVLISQGDFLWFFCAFWLRFRRHKTKHFHGRHLFFTGRISGMKSKNRYIIILMGIITKNLCKKKVPLKFFIGFSRTLLRFAWAQFLEYFTCTHVNFMGRNLS